MEILIVGAGIGGMALAALLKQRGIGCTVIDRSPDLGQAGSMITLYPMGSRVLHGLGLFEDFQHRSSEFRNYEVYNGNGDLLHAFDVTPISKEFGHTGQILRRDLIDLLRRAAEDVPVKTGLGLEHLEQTKNKVAVRFTDGTKAMFDGVVGADGLHSKTRRITFGEEPDHDTGWGLWVWWTAVETPKDTVREYWGKGRFVGVYPTPGLTGAIAAGPTDLIGPESVGQNGYRLRELFSSLGGGAKEIVASLPDDLSELSFWNLSDYRSRAWVSRRVALLGDSACAFLPNAGVGASMALESAAVMADELSRCDASLVPRAFDFYERRRRKRVEAAQDESRKLAVWMATESATLVWTRDQFMKMATVDSLIKSVENSLSVPI